VGNRRPIFERRRAPQAGDRHSGGGTRSRLRTQHRRAESRPACRPGAGRHRGPPRLLLDSGKRHKRIHRRAARHVATNIRVGHAAPIATWTVEIDGGEKYNVANTTTHGTARFRASELVEQALNGRVPTAYDEQEDGSRVINQQETLAAREKQQQLKDRFREWIWEDGAARHGWPASTTTASTICACAASTART
jgi:hypothetical protein